MKPDAQSSAPADGAYQGSPGAFSEGAARALLGQDTRLLSCATLEQTFGAVASGRARRAVIPIENTLAGSIHKSYDLLSQHDLVIVGETIRHIDHALIALPGTSLADVRRVMSHPMALAQCEAFFRQHPEIQPVSVFDTAGALETIIRERLRDAAAIASERAAEIYQGSVLLKGIQDFPENYTRFQLLAPASERVRVEHADKTTLVIRVKNVPGALVRMLRPFADRELDLAKIESRPIPSAPFEYLFYLDVLARADDPVMAGALADVRTETVSMRVLGSYRRSTPPQA
ncbi:MAG: prephenate dehydratase [Acidobacteria bacterium]|nr:prephenate dehydratase [Acidobacteriota bacterium]